MWSIQIGRLTTGLEELTAHCHLHGPLDIDYFGCRFLISISYTMYVYIIYGYCCLTGLYIYLQCLVHTQLIIELVFQFIYIDMFCSFTCKKPLTCLGYFKWLSNTQEFHNFFFWWWFELSILINKIDKSIL